MSKPRQRSPEQIAKRREAARLAMQRLRAKRKAASKCEQCGDKLPAKRQVKGKGWLSWVPKACPDCLRARREAYQTSKEPERGASYRFCWRGKDGHLYEVDDWRPETPGGAVQRGARKATL